MLPIGTKVIATLKHWFTQTYEGEIVECFPINSFIDTSREVYVNSDRVGILTHENAPLLIKEPFVAKENWYYVRLFMNKDKYLQRNRILESNSVSPIDTSALTTGIIENQDSNPELFDLIPESQLFEIEDCRLKIED